MLMLYEHTTCGTPRLPRYGRSSNPRISSGILYGSGRASVRALFTVKRAECTPRMTETRLSGAYYASATPCNAVLPVRARVRMPPSGWQALGVRSGYRQGRDGFRSALPCIPDRPRRPLPSTRQPANPIGFWGGTVGMQPSPVPTQLGPVPQGSGGPGRVPAGV